MDRSAPRDPASVWARAFTADPFMQWALPDAARRTAQLRRLFTPVVPAARCYGGLESAGPAAAGWVSGRHFPLGLRALVRTGLITVPLRLPPAAMLRIFRHEHAAEAALRDYVGADAAYLWVLGADPEAHGTGAGGRALRAALGAMAREHSRCVLKTENAGNLSFYEHHGFHVERELASPADAPPVWILSRGLADS